MTGSKFDRLVEIMATLRGPNGCPWDKEQNLDTLKPMLVEETYEVLEAVDNRDFEGLKEELGDLLLHIVFHARLAEESGRFDAGAVIEGICEKLVRRHPHVFGDDTAGSSAEVIKNWEAIKAREKAAKRQSVPADSPPSLLDGIPSKLPALHEAHQISARAARIGFDWPGVEGVLEKLEEEIAELRETLADGGQRSEEELGDMLFTMVNVARVLKIDSESALKRANRKFKSRFRSMEAALASQGRTIDGASLGEMEGLWQKAKAETSGPDV